MTTTRTGSVQNVYLFGRCAEYLQAPELIGYLDELLADRVIIPAVERAVADVSTWTTKQFTTIFQFRFFRLLLYSLVRSQRPALVVETGVLHGMTSLFLLHALDLNRAGTLVSVDLPSFFEHGPANRDGYHATLPPGKETGWMVPHASRARWDLRLGASMDVLPGLERGLDDLDLFIHDSDHTHANMTFELELAWARLRDGGVLVCDNIDSCTAFTEFCQRIQRRPLLLAAPDHDVSDTVRFAVLRK